MMGSKSKELLKSTLLDKHKKKNAYHNTAHFIKRQIQGNTLANKLDKIDFRIKKK